MGTTNNYIMIDILLPNKERIYNGPIIILLNNSKIQASYKGVLDLSILLMQFRIEYPFPKIAKLLLSILSICNTNGIALFSKTTLLFNTIIKLS